MTDSPTRVTTNPSVDVCWQKLVRDAEAEPAPTENLDLASAVMREVSVDFARRFIERYEWLGTLGPHHQHRYGLFFDEHFCAGVTTFAIGNVGVNSDKHLRWGIEREQFAYLERGAAASWAPKCSNSRLVALSCKDMARNHGVLIVCAFADRDAGEVGTIYQACNWTHVGTAGGGHQLITPTGAVRDRTVIHHFAKQRGWTYHQAQDWLVAHGCRVQYSSKKLEYVWVAPNAPKAVKAKVAEASRPYPKRAKQASDGDQPSSGGAAPTRPLQLLRPYQLDLWEACR